MCKKQKNKNIICKLQKYIYIKKRFKFIFKKISLSKADGISPQGVTQYYFPLSILARPCPILKLVN